MSRVSGLKTDLDPGVVHKILDDNGRRPLGVDPSFMPAPKATVLGLAPELIAAGLPAPDRPGWRAAYVPDDVGAVA